jgi:hypothetical protein
METEKPEDRGLADPGELPGELPEIGFGGLRNFRPRRQYRARMISGVRSSPPELRLLIVINLVIVVAIAALLVLK